MSVFHFIIGCLVTYRLSLLVTKEDGPAWIFSKLRKLPPPRSSARKGLSCQLCMSMWTGALMASYYAWMKEITWTESTIYGFAFSAVAIFLHMKFTKSI